MIAKVFSAFPYGLEARLVEIEIALEPGLRSFQIIGLPDETVKESSKRVNAAIKSAGFESPSQLTKRVTVNLAPADIKKQGSFFDLPIAVGFLIASGQLPQISQDALFIGELNLEGSVRSVSGVLPVTHLARREGFGLVMVPKANIHEASLVSLAKTVAVSSLGEAVAILTHQISLPKIAKPRLNVEGLVSEYDFFDIKGQASVKRALEIAAAGGHHLLLTGPPGAGKSILAKAFPALLPPLSGSQALERAMLLSSFDTLPYSSQTNEVKVSRPFRAPHHTASAQALLGGGGPIRPGEVTLAHHGVLFLDEFPEFHRDVLEGLRQPLEEGLVKISRSNERFTFPSRFQLIAAANPCPCGFKDDPAKPCICTPGALSRYERKLSGPLVDRIDMFSWVPRVSKDEMLAQGSGGEDSATIRKRVTSARVLQAKRFLNHRTNSEMGIKEVRKICPLTPALKPILGRAIDQYHLSMRAYHKVLKVARTIADLEGSQTLKEKHLMEALQYRKPL